MKAHNLYLIVIVLCALYVMILEIFGLEICMTLSLTFNMGKKSNENVPMEIPRATFYLFSIVMSATSVTTFEIFTVEI